MLMAMAELPNWLCDRGTIRARGARHRVMQKNVLHLASLLERVRLGGERARGAVDGRPRPFLRFGSGAPGGGCSFASCACA